MGHHSDMVGIIRIGMILISTPVDIMADGMVVDGTVVGGTTRLGSTGMARRFIIMVRGGRVSGAAALRRGGGMRPPKMTYVLASATP